ncbi:uncharacterized protein LOC144669321 [Cetorhinus maximus]
MAPSEYWGIMPVVNPVACLKFEANIFDRSRCQNCFKAFNLHRKDDCRGDNQLQYGNRSLNLCASAVSQEDLHIVTPDCNLYCRSSPEEMIASWQVEPRMHNTLTSQLTRKWAMDTTPFRSSELSNTMVTRGHSSRGERMLGPSVSALQGESRNWDTHSDSPLWSQLHNRKYSRGRSDTAESRGKTVTSKGPELVSGEWASSRNTRVESGYFSLERAIQDSAHNPSPGARRTAETKGAGQSGSAAPGNAAGAGGLHALSRLTSSQSSFESESSWGAGSVASSDGRLLRREYTVLADIPKPRRIISRERLEQDTKQPGQRIRTRSPGREEVERLFGQERRPVTDTHREFNSANVGKMGRESATSYRPNEETRKSNIYPRKFQQQEATREISQPSFSNLLKGKDRDAPSTTMYERTDRGQSKQISSNSLETKEKHRYIPHQYDKMGTKYHSQKDELKFFTKCPRAASETNKANERYLSREESKTNMRYLRSSLQNGKKMFQAASQEQNYTKINSKPKKILEEPAESLVKEIGGKFSLKEESKTYTGYLRSSPKNDKAGGSYSKDDSCSYTGYLQSAPKLDSRFSSQDQSTLTGYVRSSPQRDKAGITFSSLEEQNTYTGSVRALSRTDRVDTRLNTPEESNPYTGYRWSSLTSDKTGRAFSNRSSSTSLNRDVYLQTSDKHNMTDRGFSTRSSSDSLNRDVYLQTSDNYDNTDRGSSSRNSSSSLNRDVYLLTSDNYDKTDRGFSSRNSSSSLNRDVYLLTSDNYDKVRKFCICLWNVIDIEKLYWEYRNRRRPFS